MTELKLTDGFDGITRESWLALVAKVLNGADFDKALVSSIVHGLRIEPLYTRADARAGAGSLVPGRAPFTRGRAASLERSGWDICQRHAEAEPKAANKAILEDLAGGATSIMLQLAAPGQFGLACDAGGIKDALAGVDLGICSLALQAGENFGFGAGHLLAAWRMQNLADDDRRGSFNADPLGTLATTGGLSQPLEQSMQGAVALMARVQLMPHVRALLADGHPYHAAGAGEAQELAAMLATLVAYLRAGEAGGVAPAKALPKIGIALAADTDQFATIAKLRAARLLIWRAADAVGIGAAAGGVHLTAETASRMMSRRDPWVNMLRTTIACAGAAMGGADAVTVLPFTWALGKPDALARRIARNTQIVLQEEASLGRVVDPAGGSWYVEKLTDDMARAAWALFQDIEAKGGMAASLMAGHIQDMIGDTAKARAKDVSCGRVALTGVTAFPILGDDGVNALPHDPPLAVATGATIVRPLSPARLSEPFEALRDAADAYAARTGTPPQVFLAYLGDSADFNSRALWARNFFAAGGIEALANNGFTNAADVGAAFAASGAVAACICSSEEVYGELAEAVAGLLKTVGAEAVYLAGRPGELEAALRAAGVDGFMYTGCDMIETLRRVHDTLGIPSNSAS